MHTIGAICLATTPTPNATADVRAVLGRNVRILEAGGLDGLCEAEIRAQYPQPGEEAMTSNMADGTPVVFRKEFILPRLQTCIDRLEAQGVEMIMLYCGGDFRGVFRANVPVLYALPLMRAIVPLMTRTSRVAIMTPLPEQANEAVNKWREYVREPIPVIGSPHEGMGIVRRAALRTRDLDVDLAVLDCFGFTNAMQREFSRVSGKTTISSRMVLAHAVAATIDRL